VKVQDVGLTIKKRWKDILYISLGLFLIGVLMLRADVTDTLDKISGLDPRPILLVLFLYFLNLSCKVIRWYGMVKGMGGRNLGPIVMPIFLASLALNNSTPGKIGGEPARALMFKEHTGNSGSMGIASIFAEKSLDMLAILSFAAFGLIYLVIELGFEDVRGMVIAIAIGGSVIVTAIIVMLNRGVMDLFNRILRKTTGRVPGGSIKNRLIRIVEKLEGIAERFHRSLKNIRKQRAMGIGMVLMTVAIWLNEALRIYIIVHAMPGDLTISFPGAVAIISVANILGFILPIGSGNVIGGASIIELLTGDGTSATAASLTQVITSLWLSIPLGVVSLLYLNRRSRKKVPKRNQG
jgi:uncharacterized protein (TIRG00374 family)